MRLASPPAAAVGVMLAAAGALPPPQDRLPDPPPLTREAFAGHTLSAVTFGPGSKGSSVGAVMWQAFLQPDGAALLRHWDTGRNSYAPAVRTTWELRGERFCLGQPPAGATGAACVDLHGWGTTLHGIGADGRSMVKGDLKPGNLVTAARP